MKTFLIIHGGYTVVECALIQRSTLLEQVTLHKHRASKELIPSIASLFEKTSLSLSDCSAIIVHQGPGPFTTLRTILATANGLALGSDVPLVGVDGLDAFIRQEAPNCTSHYLGVVLNAFCNDVYYALFDITTGELLKGCLPVESFIIELKKYISHDPNARKAVTLTGNGALLYRELFEAELSPHVFFPDIIAEMCSLEAIAALGQELFAMGKTSNHLLPLYLKEGSAIRTTAF